MPGYAAIEVKKNELIRKGLQGSVFVAPYTSAAIDITTLFDSSGNLLTLPSGYSDLGWTDTTGAVFARKVTNTEIMGWGTNDPVRSDLTADTSTLAVQSQETNLHTLGLYAGVDESSISPAGPNGAISIPHPSSPVARFYRVLAVAVDEGTGGEIVVARFMPRCQVTNFTSQSFNNTKDPVVYGVEFTAYQDSVLGYSQEQIFGGPGWLYLLSDMGISRIVVCTTALTTALVATTGTFTAADVGKTVTGTGIPAGTTIASFTDSTDVVLSDACTIAGSNVNVTIAA